MTKKPLLLIVLGTARAGNQSQKVAKAALTVLQERNDCEIKLVEAKDYIYGYTIAPWEQNPMTKPWRELTKEAAAFLIVTPEYNHGYPGELKMLLDQELENYRNKPVVVCSTSAGGFGGTRVVENLLPVFRELGLLISSYSIHVSQVRDFPEDSTQADEKFKERVNKAAEELMGMIRN